LDLAVSQAALDSYPPMADNDKRVELIETSVFTRQITALLSDEEYGDFQSRIRDSALLLEMVVGSARFALRLDRREGGAAAVSYTTGLCGKT